MYNLRPLTWALLHAGVVSGIGPTYSGATAAAILYAPPYNSRLYR